MQRSISTTVVRPHEADRVRRHLRSLGAEIRRSFPVTRHGRPATCIAYEWPQG